MQAKLIVELDGEPHEASDRKYHDRERDIWLREQGWRVLRIANEVVLGGGDAVMIQIKKELELSPHPTSLREATFSRLAGEGPQPRPSVKPQ